MTDSPLRSIAASELGYAIRNIVKSYAMYFKTYRMDS